MLNPPQIQHSLPIFLMSTRKPISDDDAVACRALMRKFAEEVVQFLTTYNSTMHFIHVHPLLMPLMAADWDGDDR